MKAAAAGQIPRGALAWLLLAQLLLIAPHIPRLPSWVALVWAACGLWRWQVFLGRWNWPGRWIRLGLIVACFAGTWLHYRSLVGLEPTVALLISAFSLKLLEMSARRDAYVIVMLGYFVALTQFLFAQDLLITLYQLSAVLVVSAALLALHRDDRRVFAPQVLRKASLMMAQALPLMLVLFLVFPRLAPLWQVPTAGHSARTGVSDSMAPGDISELSRSGALAFRARFDGPLPPAEDLYWRGIVLSDFDGRRWSASRWANYPAAEESRAARYAGLAADYRYTVIIEPTYQRWLFALETSLALSPNVIQARDDRLLATDILREPTLYRAASFTLPAERRGSADYRDWDLALPAQGNARARRLATDWQRTWGDKPEAIVNAALAMYRREAFVYTLQPPALAGEVIDGFLFDTRRGFCGHYAGSFVFLMRAAGIPARVVAGYQGGELNPITRTILVHQFDAHAWAEVWLPGRGWVRVDPTAAVAPERIERGFDGALTGDELAGSDLLSAARWRHVQWFNSLRLRLDALNYQWVNWVLNYRGETQMQVLQGLLGAVTPLRMALLMCAGLGLALAAAGLALWWRRPRHRHHPLDVLYLRCCARLAAAGWPRAQGESPQAYLQRLAGHPAQPQLAEITDIYTALRYKPLPAQRREALQRALRRRVRRFRP